METDVASTKTWAYCFRLLIEPFWNGNVVVPHESALFSSLLIEPFWNGNFSRVKARLRLVSLLIEPFWNGNKVFLQYQLQGDLF